MNSLRWLRPVCYVQPNAGRERPRHGRLPGVVCRGRLLLEQHTQSFPLAQIGELTGQHRSRQLVGRAGELGIEPQGAYSEGRDTSALLPQYKGVGILRGATDASPTVRTYAADGQDAERILIAARALRQRAGTLSGMALGERDAEARDVLADVLAVVGTDRGGTGACSPSGSPRGSRTGGRTAAPTRSRHNCGRSARSRST